MRVGVIGALGKMGSAVCQAVNQDPDLELVAQIDISAKSSLEQALKENINIDVAVDFTESSAAKNNLKLLAENGIHAVVGTSGIDDKTIKSLKKDFQKSNCIIAPNFSISAVIMMRLAEIAAPHFESAEIVELHHESKIDAPSGTAIETQKRIEAASDKWLPDPTQKENLPSSRGATSEKAGKKSGVRIHSIRLKGLVAHQEILFGAEGQSLIIGQDTFDRTAFMPGVLLAIKEISNHPGVTLGLDKFLGI